VDFIEDLMEDILWGKLLGSIGSLGSSDISANDKELLELILGSIPSSGTMVTALAGGSRTCIYYEDW
jgi:hypothetical protein